MSSDDPHSLHQDTEKNRDDIQNVTIFCTGVEKLRSSILSGLDFSTSGVS
jgi:hypothetical protein